MGASENMTLAMLLSKLDSLQYQDLPNRKGYCSSCEKNFQVDVWTLASRARTWFSGLCLDCVKYGKSDDKTASNPACRIKHDEDFLGVHSSA